MKFKLSIVVFFMGLLISSQAFCDCDGCEGDDNGNSQHGKTASINETGTYVAPH